MLTQLVPVSRRSSPIVGTPNVLAERGRALWAHVMTLSDGRAAEAPEVCPFLRGGRGRPDDRVRGLVDHTAQALQAPERGGAA